MRFNFNRNGHANRRDPDALPRVLLVGIDEHQVHVHVAGEQHVRVVPVNEAVLHSDLIEGMDPGDACRVGAEWSRWCRSVRKEKAAEA